MDKLELGKQLFEQNLDLDYYLPKREDIQNFSVGQWAVDCFGKLGIITEIFGRGNDVNGLAYICYYTQLGEHSTISHSLKEGKLVRTLPLTCKFKSFELDAIEAYLISREKQNGKICDDNIQPVTLEMVMNWVIELYALSFAVDVNDIKNSLISNDKQPPHCDYCHTNHYGYQDHYMA